MLRPLAALLAVCLAALMGALTSAVPPAAAMRMVAESPEYRVFDAGANLTTHDLETTSEGISATRRRILGFLGPGESAPRVDYYLYPTLEAKGLATGDTRPAHVDHQRHAVHFVENDWTNGEASRAGACLLARMLLGRPKTHLLEMGLAVYLSTPWRGGDFRCWAARLHATDNAPPLAELLDNTALERESYLVAEPLAGAFVEFVVKRFGRGTLLRHYATWEADSSEVAKLDGVYTAYLDQLVSEFGDEIEPTHRHDTAHGTFKKGFCHAHEGYQIFNGYISRKSDEAIEKLVDLGANAISLTPFTYMPDPNTPVRLRFSSGVGQESDESIIHAAHTARRLGMSVMLKPHIWLGGHHWPGSIEMQTTEDWNRFFDYYYRWIRHYAVLAELYDVDMLCIGVELARATVGHEAEWMRIITRLRDIYSGEMTYAANWGDEFENVTFWDALDYIGINCYYPLADRGDATPEDLARGANRMMARLEAVHAAYDKPVLLTEIGFTSTPAPWRAPHESARRKATQLQHQALCYETIFEALQGRTWCDGIYWWKWPSFLEYGGPHNPGFTPNSKPAEDVVRKWFGREW